MNVLRKMLEGSLSRLKTQQDWELALSHMPALIVPENVRKYYRVVFKEEKGRLVYDSHHQYWFEGLYDYLDYDRVFRFCDEKTTEEALLLAAQQIGFAQGRMLEAICKEDTVYVGRYTLDFVTVYGWENLSKHQTILATCATVLSYDFSVRKERLAEAGQSSNLVVEEARRIVRDDNVVRSRLGNPDMAVQMQNFTSETSEEVFKLFCQCLDMRAMHLWSEFNRELALDEEAPMSSCLRVSEQIKPILTKIRSHLEYSTVDDELVDIMDAIPRELHYQKTAVSFRQLEYLVKTTYKVSRTLEKPAVERGDSDEEFFLQTLNELGYNKDEVYEYLTNKIEEHSQSLSPSQKLIYYQQLHKQYANWSQTEANHNLQRYELKEGIISQQLCDWLLDECEILEAEEPFNYKYGPIKPINIVYKCSNEVVAQLFLAQKEIGLIEVGSNEELLRWIDTFVTDHRKAKLDIGHQLTHLEKPTLSTIESGMDVITALGAYFEKMRGK